MAQFDVYRVKGGVLVLDCQSDIVNDLKTRFVVPLRQVEQNALKRLQPTFDIDGVSLTMVTPLARGIDRREIQATVENLADREYEITAALDMLLSGY